MNIYTIILTVLVVVLIHLNIYQYLVQHAAVRIAEILFVMSRNLREKANEAGWMARTWRSSRRISMMSPLRPAACQRGWAAGKKA